MTKEQIMMSLNKSRLETLPMKQIVLMFMVNHSGGTHLKNLF